MVWIRSVAAVVLVVGVAALPSAAVASPTDHCRQASHARGVRVKATDRDAVVFIRHDNYFGCLYGHGPIRLLGHDKGSQICPCNQSAFRLAGRFAAFTYEGSAIGDESSKLGVYDLRSGRVRRVIKLSPMSEGALLEIETSALVTKFTVTRTGSLAWIQSAPLFATPGQPAPHYNSFYEVRTAAGPHPRETVVDHGNIAPSSLRLAAGGSRISWIKDGVTRSAPLAR